MRVSFSLFWRIRQCCPDLFRKIMKLSTKVLVIGGGPAGATAARLLAEQNIEVVLLERNLSYVKPCGGGLSFSGFEEFDIPRTAIRKEIDKIRIVSPRGEKLDIELKGGGLAIVERGKFDAGLRQAAEEKGAKIIEGEFVSVSSGNHLSKVVASNGEDVHEISSEYIIAADGVNSKVRTAAGIKPARSFFTISERIKGLSSDLCEFWFGSSHAPFAYSWIFPSSQGVSIGTASLEPGTVHNLMKRFKERTQIQAEGDLKIYRIPVWEGDLYNKDKILFVGDSAGQVMPLTYEGIYYAMKAGEFAARAIAEEKVNNYKRIWKERFQKKFTIMEKLRNFFLKDDDSAEKLVAMHRRPDVQMVSLRLWLRHDGNRDCLRSYIRIFGKFFH
jgi:geranylgeranyl reductase